MATANLYFSQHFGVSSESLSDYGAFDISVVTDLPLFVDPFLLFNSEKPEYQDLHQEIVEYLKFLKSVSDDELDSGTIKNLYRFAEVRQNWFGFSVFGNAGHGLGNEFAKDLNQALGRILKNLGEEQGTKGTHLEKLTLVRPGVGKDNISDFTTNLIKHYLLEYTQTFAKEFIDPALCGTFPVPRARFNYETETWMTESYFLPILRNDFVLLTPADILVHDDTWINYNDMVGQFPRLAAAVDNDVARSQINRHFESTLGPKPSTRARWDAAANTIQTFPELIDLYISLQEDNGDGASRRSALDRATVDEAFRKRVNELIEDLLERTDFYDEGLSSYEEAIRRIEIFKTYVEDKEGYRLLNKPGEKFGREADVQIFFGLACQLTKFDVNREPNNGRGPVDFKLSFGAADKTLIEFKLASNTSLERNLKNQVAIYEKANETKQSLKVIVFYTQVEETKVKKILAKTGLDGDESVILIDARSDNKASASTV